MTDVPKYVNCLLVSGGRKVAGHYTYALPVEWASEVKRGSLLLVPVRKKLRMAVALDFPGETEVENIKMALSLFDGPPIINEKQLMAAEWLRKYYVTPPVASIKPFLIEIRALKVVNQIKLVDTEKLIERLNEKGFLFVHKDTVDAFSEGKSMTRRRLEKLLAEGGFESDVVGQVIDGLLHDGILQSIYSIERKRRVIRGDSFVRLTDAGNIETVKLTDKQKEIIDYIRGVDEPVKRSSIIEAYPKSIPVLAALKKKGLVEIYTAPSLSYEPSDIEPMELTQHQGDALKQINGYLDEGKSTTVLLHGVTGSGKTEVYVQASHHAVDSGRRVLVLVPEIALTHQVVRRFACDFPGRLAVLHSELSQGERVGEWERIRNREASIVIGARSALFAPMDDIGLIILDEEHEPSYKQSSMPRYHARELARRMADLHEAVLILGSATPSMESYELAQSGRFKLIELPERISGGPLPEIELVKRRFVKVEIPGGKIVRRLQVITDVLRDAIEDVLNRDKQALLFLNQRGFSKSLACPECELTYECPDCRLPLVHHTKTRTLQCHHCGHKQSAPETCPTCGDVKLISIGVGTQRLEEEIAGLFPSHPLHRLDRDVADTLGGSRKVLDDFRHGRARILLGTQMIAKGLDFADVELVGVISAEDSLAIPDFRAAERTFQLLTQVAGRAGRREARGRVIVQGIRLDHYSVKCATEYDFNGFFKQEKRLRQHLGYPPYKHLARIVVSAVDFNRANMSAEILGETLRRIGKRIPQVEILGPAPAPLERLRGLWRRHFIFKSAKVNAISKLLHVGFSEVRFPSEVKIEIDIDPLHMM